MGLSVFAMVAAIVKTVQIKFIGERGDFTWDTIIFVIWFSIENYIVIVCSSVPTIRPLLLWIKKKRHPSQFSSNTGRSGASRKPAAQKHASSNPPSSSTEMGHARQDAASERPPTESLPSQHSRHSEESRAPWTPSRRIPRLKRIRKTTDFEMISGKRSPSADLRYRDEFPFPKDDQSRDEERSRFTSIV